MIPSKHMEKAKLKKISRIGRKEMSTMRLRDVLTILHDKYIRVLVYDDEGGLIELTKCHQDNVSDRLINREVMDLSISEETNGKAKYIYYDIILED